jgi:hypothetical protein
MRKRAAKWGDLEEIGSEGEKQVEVNISATTERIWLKIGAQGV